MSSHAAGESDSPSAPRQLSAPPSTPSSSSSRRPRPPDLNLFNLDDPVLTIPSPPYKRNPSNSNLFFGAIAEASPAYKSRSNLDLPNESTPMVEDVPETHERREKEPSDEDAPRSKPKTARFQEDVRSPTTSLHPTFARTETMETDVSSIADTDDDDDYYDWSGEDDLVDEEAKFEESMGVAKARRWGFRK